MKNKLNKVLGGCFLVLSLAFISSIAMAASVPGKVTGTNVNFRKAPNTSSTIISRLSNSSVTVIDKSNGWYKVSYNNKTGWVNADYLKITSTQGIINANSVNFRTGPGTNAKKITFLNKNTAVVILDTVNGWNKVKIGTKVGYVSAKFVSTTTAAKVSRSTNAAAVTTLDVKDDAVSINDKIVAYAKQFIGVRYKYGGANPQTGFDCSGLVGYIYQKFGIKLNRSAQSMYSNGVKVSKSQLEPGDILFFDASSRKASGVIDHAGIYLGGDSFIHASSSNRAVRIQKLSEYRGTYIGAKRVI